MGSTDTISERSVKKAAKAAGKEAAREVLLDMQLGGDETEGMSLEHLDGNSDETLGEAAAGFDIFQDVGKQLSEKGEILKYIIKREGERVGSKYHPYSWERLAKDYGPGHYQVIARSESRNRFIKSQTQIIGDVEAWEEPDHEEGETTQEAAAPKVGWQQPNLGFLEMWNLMQSQSDRARQEATQTATQQAQSQVAMITAMTEMMKNAQLQSQQMFMEMTKMSAQISEKMAASQEKLVERLNQRMDKISEVATKKPEGPSYVDLMKLQSESQNKGFELFEKIMKLAELKAEEKVELIESAREVNGGGEEKKKSLTDSLIESLLPVVAAAVAGRQMMPQEQATLPVQRNQQALPRRSIRPPQANNGAINRTIQRGQGTQPAPHQAGVQKKAQEGQKPSSPSINAGRASVGPSIVVGKPSAVAVITPNSSETTAPEVKEEGLVKEELRLADKVEVIETPVELTNIREQVKAQCNELLPMFLGNLMLEETAPHDAATKTIEFLDGHGISRELFIKNVEAKDLVDVAVQFNLPSEAHQWLNDLYAHIQNVPRTNARRKSATSAEQRAAQGS